MKKGRQKRRYYVAAVSWGRDSAYMLLDILKSGMPLDEVVSFNTGVEFDAVYKVRDKGVEMLKQRGIKYTELEPSHPFFYYMLQKPVCKKGTDTVHRHGYSWCGGVCRWGTSLKLAAFDNYYRKHLSDYDVYEYVGYAANEAYRMERKVVSSKKIYPLIEKKITESMCLWGCYEAGFFYEEDGYGLYDFFDHLSCWCCRNKNKKELYHMYWFFPKYFEKLKALQKMIPEPMKGDKDVFMLEEEFKSVGCMYGMYD